MYSVASRQKLWHRAHPSERIWPPLFSPDSQVIAVATEKYAFSKPRLTLNISLREVTTGKQRRVILPTISLLDLQSYAFLSPRELVVSTTQSVLVADTQTGEILRRWKIELPALPIKKGPLPDQAHVSADGSAVMVLTNGTFATAVALYDSATGKKRGTWTYPGVFRNPRLSPDGKLWILQRTNDDMADVYDAVSGQKLWGPFVADNADLPWAWSADGHRILTSVGARLALIDARTGRNLRQMTGKLHTQSVALAPDGNHYYTLDDRGQIWRWRAR